MGETLYSKVSGKERDRSVQRDQDEDNQIAIDDSSMEIESNLELSTQPESGDAYKRSNLIFSVDEAIDHLEMGRFQFVILTAAGLCFAADAMQVLQLTFLSEVLRSEWNLNDDETALITSMLFFGAIFGTLTLGPLADKKGRKFAFLLAASIISFFGVGVAMFNSYWVLLGNLFMVGFGVGGVTVPFDILAEFLPNNARGKNLLVIEYFWTVGVLFVICIAYSTLGDGHETSNWRLFVIICAIPCWFSLVIGYLFVPESPRWLCSQGRSDEALEILKSAARTNRLDVECLYPQGMRLNDKKEEDSNFCELFSPQWLWTTIKLWGVWFCFALGYYGIIIATTEIFTNEEDTKVKGKETFDGFDYGAIFVSSSSELIGITIAIFSIDTCGRIPLQMISYALAGLLACSLYLSTAYDCHRSIIVSFGFSARIFEMTASCVTWVSTPEILSTEVRSTGHSTANAVARIGALISPFLIEGHGSLVRKGLFMLVIHAVAVIFVSQLPETKGSHMGLPKDDNIMQDNNISNNEMVHRETQYTID